MTPRTRGTDSPRQAASPINAVFASLVFGALTVLVAPPWTFIDSSNAGYLTLTAAHFLPLFALSLISRPGSLRQWGACGVAALGSVALCLHAGLSDSIVANIDSGERLSGTTALAITEIYFSTIAVPVGLLLCQRRAAPTLTIFLLLPTLTAVASQILWFGLVRAVQGPGGIEFWFATRVLIHLGFGMTAGFFWAGARLFRPHPYPSSWGGFSEWVFSRLPHALFISMLGTGALIVSGLLRVNAELSDTTRLVTHRLDDYFLSLTNLRRARQADLVYAELYTDLERSRNALLGAASFDPELVHRTRAMLREIERETPKRPPDTRFRDSVLAVNRRLLANGEPFFLEPHAVGREQDRMRFLFRYRVERRSRYRQQDGRSIPMLRLRRLDDILIDTPYTGLSYPGLGTVLMDHIEETVLRADARLFDPDALVQNPEEGRFAATALQMRRDRRRAIEQTLGPRYSKTNRLKKLAAFSLRFGQLADLSRVRAKMDVETLAAFDALTEAVALQTEIHEARHSFDSKPPATLPELDELSAGPLASSAVSEIRAYLTEIIDGPLGPEFGLSTLAKMIIGRDARANAYFFASMVILEGLWGEKVRRPDIVEQPGDGGPRAVVMPISVKHPGWLSYSRIHGAYSDLSALASDELKARAAALYERLFEAPYQSVFRNR